MATKINTLSGQKAKGGFFTLLPQRKKQKTAGGKIIKVPVPKASVEASLAAAKNVGATATTNPTNLFPACAIVAEVAVAEVVVEVEPTKVAALPKVMEHRVCYGVPYRDLSVDFSQGYDFVWDYPFSIHSQAAQTSYDFSNLCPSLRWTVDIDRNRKSLNCQSLVVWNKNNLIAVNDTTTRAGKTACTACVHIQFAQPLLKVMAKSVSKDYGRTPNLLCPSSVVGARISEMNHAMNNLRLTRCNQGRKISTLTSRFNDNSCLLLMIQDQDIPGIKRLAVVHFRNGGSSPSFMDRCMCAAEYKMVGHSTYQ